MAARVAAALLTASLAAACGSDAPSVPIQADGGGPRNPAPIAEGEPFQPQIDPADFVPVIDNPYLPLIPGTELRYEGVSDGEREVVEIMVTDRTKEIMGVTATVVRDRAYVGGELVEETLDWFAQDRAGNVWYLGEASTEFENGKPVGTPGSWEAGADGAQPGVVMLADPRPGDAYRQEFYRGEAEDTASVLELDESVTVPYGPFTGVLVTEDLNPLEPGHVEHKFYAPGIGVVLERLVEGGQGVLRLVQVRTDPF